jgi:hypothetical protein
MDPRTIPALQEAIRAEHGCESRFVESLPVVIHTGGRIEWSGEVAAFDLLGHAKAVRAYAWATRSSSGPRFAAMLQGPRVENPELAVRAHMAREKQERTGHAS